MKICKRCEETHNEIIRRIEEELTFAREWTKRVLKELGHNMDTAPEHVEDLLTKHLEPHLEVLVKQATGYLTSDLAEAILRSPEAREEFATDYMAKLDYDLAKQGENLHRLRKKAGVKLWLAAAHLGMEKDILKAAENGKATLPATMLLKLARLYECKASDFIEGCLIEKQNA